MVFGTIESITRDERLQEIKQVYALLKQNNKLEISEINSLNKEIIEHTLEQYNTHLGERRILIESLKRLDDMFNSMIEIIEKPDPETSSFSIQPDTKTPQNKKSFGMQFIQKLSKKR